MRDNIFWRRAYRIYEIVRKNTYDQFLASSASSLAFANILIGTSLGLSSDSLTPSQSKKAKDLLRLIALNGDIKCLKLQSNSYSLSYPPKQFCNIEDETLMISEKLQRSTGLFLNLYIEDSRLSLSIGNQRLLYYFGGAILIIGALGSGAFYSNRRTTRLQKETDKLVDKIIASNPNPYLIINKNLQIIAISGSLEKYIIKGNANNSKSIKNDLIALELDHFFSNDSVKRISAFLKTIEIESLEKAVDMKYLGVNKNKNLVFSASISIIRYGKSENFFMSLFDETQSSVQKNYLNELLSKDSLTGAYSRRYLFDSYSDFVRKNKYILFLIDIDNFKETNDSHGHDAGDNLLRELTEYLERFFGAEAQIFRLGGDEFVVLRRFYDHESIEIISSDLNKSSKINFTYHGRLISKSFSFGSTILDSSDKLSFALKRTDDALIQAKNKGKNTYIIANANEFLNIVVKSSKKNKLTIAELHDAYIMGFIKLYLQPVISCDSGSPVGFEALIRLEGENGLIPPDNFLDSLYQVSLLSDFPVDHYSLLDELLSKIRPSLSGWISYNVNELDLGDSCFDRLLYTLSTCTTQYNRDLVLEISETTFQTAQNSSTILDRISLLKSRGFRIALDDFGVLSSNIFALSSLPVDIVKLDKFLITDIETNLKNQRIIESLKDLSKSLGFELLAEGIESQSEANCLKDLGIELHQGYLYGKAMPAKNF